MWTNAEGGGAVEAYAEITHRIIQPQLWPGQHQGATEKKESQRGIKTSQRSEGKPFQVQKILYVRFRF